MHSQINSQNAGGAIVRVLSHGSGSGRPIWQRVRVQLDQYARTIWQRVRVRWRWGNYNNSCSNHTDDLSHNNGNVFSYYKPNNIAHHFSNNNTYLYPNIN